MIRKLLLSALFYWLVAGASPAHAAKHALLIGIADYSKTDYATLDGSLNDIDLVRGMLMQKFQFPEQNIRVLKDAQATHEGIRQAFAELAAKVQKDDIVYIHYSGHGSLTPDLKGEKKPLYAGGPAYDSTWVPFGARPRALAASAAVNLDDYDVLDDEVGEWLIPVYTKTDNIVFVSDSCHSGNMTRGEAPKARAIDPDRHPHPLARRKFPHPDKIGVVIGAAREDQSAYEYGADGRKFGLFTWHWVQALYMSAQGESWDDAYKRTVALIGALHETQQHPQIQGQVKRAIFDRDFPPPVQAVAVSELPEEGEATLKAGSFMGVTVGSTYRKRGGDDLLEITSVEPFSSTAEVKKGAFRAGDFVVEETHSYPYEPLKIFVTADAGAPAADREWADAISKTAAGTPGYAVVGSQREADLLLLVIRPLRQQGQLVKATPADTLPRTDPAANPELWLLSPSEGNIREKLPAMVPHSKERAMKLVGDNLRRLARVLELKRIGATDAGAASLLELTVSRYTPDATCKGGMPECFTGVDKKSYRLEVSLPSHEMQDSVARKGDLLTFRVKNNGSFPLYCYLLDIAKDCEINVVFPDPNDSNAGAALVPAGREVAFTDVYLTVDQEGEDTLKLIASEMPLDARIFPQDAFQTRGAKRPEPRRGSNSPLERFLDAAMTGTTRGGVVRQKQQQWGTAMFSFLAK